MQHKFHPSILREYDIRGIVGQTLFEADAYALGYSFAKITFVRSLKSQVKILVGRDGRISSPALSAALVKGMVDAGADVVEIGIGPTPMLYYASFICSSDSSIQVTGSHNPPSHNGFKMMMGRSAFFADDIVAIGRSAAAGFAQSNLKGSVSQIDISDDYINRLLEESCPNDLAIGWDPANGAAGSVLGRIVQKLSGRNIIINEAVDGTFPAHHPDPTDPKNLVMLQELVASNKLDMGISFDGDADRIGVVDSQGRIVWADQLLAILALDLLQDNPGQTIIADVKTSQAFFDTIVQAGGKPLMWKTGHSIIKAKMHEIHGLLAGEMSGHIFFADRWFGFDDAIYVALRLIKAVVRSGRSLDQLYDLLPKCVNTPEIRFDCADEKKFVIVDTVKELLQRRSDISVNTIDGVRVTTSDGWWLLRASNTQASLVVRAEGYNNAGLERLKADLRSVLQQAGVTPPNLD